MVRRVRLATALAAVAVLALVLLVALAAQSGSYVSSITPPPAGPTTTPTAASTPATRTPEPTGAGGSRESLPRSSVVGDVLLAAALLGATVGTAAVVRWLLRLRRSDDDPRAGASVASPASPRTAVRDAVDDARADVAAQPVAREAVVRAWLHLLDAASVAGTAAKPSETATEYARRLGADLELPGPPLERLADLYRMARFSDHRVGDDHRNEAAGALNELRRSLEAR